MCNYTICTRAPVSMTSCQLFDYRGLQSKHKVRRVTKESYAVPVYAFIQTVTKEPWIMTSLFSYNE